MAERKARPSDENSPREREADDNRSDSAHRDPITREPGSHPLGTAAGSAAGAAAGAVIGAAVGGPGGALVGGAVGAIAGGAAGHMTAEKVNPTVESAYWRDTYATRPYVKPGVDYDEYEPAYRYGWESRERHRGRRFDEVESDLEQNWDRVKGRSRLAWRDARHAARDAWDRIKERVDDERDRR